MKIFSKRVCVSILAAIFILIVSCTPSPHRAVLENGSLDWESALTNGKCFRLAGDWKFAWLGEAPKRELPETPEKFTLQTVPGSWNETDWFGTPLPKYGKALYRLELYSKAPVERLHLVSYDQGTNYRILFNGVPITEVGKVGDPSPEALALLTSYTILPVWQGKANLDFEISNYNYRKGGLWKPPIFGEGACVGRYYMDRRDLEAILCGGLFFLGLFHIFVSIFYKKDSSAFVLALFSITVGLRLYSTGVRLLPEHFLIGPEIYLRIEFITWFFGMPLGLHFLYSVFPIQFGRSFLKIVYYFGYASAGIFSLITLVTGPDIYSYLIGPSYVVFILISAFSL